MQHILQEQGDYLWLSKHWHLSLGEGFCPEIPAPVGQYFSKSIRQ